MAKRWRINKPADLDEGPGWVEEMDDYDGYILTEWPDIDDGQFTLDGWDYSEDWLTEIDDTNEAPTAMHREVEFVCNERTGFDFAIEESDFSSPEAFDHFVDWAVDMIRTLHSTGGAIKKVVVKGEVKEYEV